MEPSHGFPIQLRAPCEKETQAFLLHLSSPLSASIQRVGINFSGFEKFLSSCKMAYVGVLMIVFGVSNTVEMHMYIAWNETTSDHHPFRRCFSLQIRRCCWTKTRGWTIRAHSILEGYFHISGPQGKAGWPNERWRILPLNWNWKEVRPEGGSNEVD